MNVSVNGKEHITHEGASLASLLEDLSISRDEKGIAIALDYEVIPRDLWERTVISCGMKIEVVRAVAGG